MHDPVTPTEVRSALARVVASPLFQNAGRSRALLQFIIEEFVAGRADQLKEYTLGAVALGRGESFDPRTDLSAVRLSDPGRKPGKPAKSKPRDLHLGFLQ